MINKIKKGLIEYQKCGYLLKKNFFLTKIVSVLWTPAVKTAIAWISKLLNTIKFG